jgi:hypothetical protein
MYVIFQPSDSSDGKVGPGKTSFTERTSGIDTADAVWRDARPIAMAERCMAESIFEVDV